MPKDAPIAEAKEETVTLEWKPAESMEAVTYIVEENKPDGWKEVKKGKL